MNLMNKLRKKNNDHGFTLVELIVAIGVFAIVMAQVSAIVFNCSKLYTKGVEQVDMQTEAQRVIQLTEELMIDATQSISVNDSVGAPGSQDITIVTNTVDGGNYQYDIYLKKTSPTDKSGDLFLKKTDIATGTTVADEIMAENVKSISCDMANYATDDRVTVNVCMQSAGEKYDYDSVAIKDIYLRNDIGSGVKDGDGAEVAGKYKLDVRRYAKYNLASLYGSEYKYEFEADNNADKIYYTLGSDFTLSCVTALNKNASKKTSCIINAYLKSDDVKASPEFTIVVNTKKVRVGLGDEGSFNGTAIAYGCSKTAKGGGTTSFIDIDGITLFEDTTKVENGYCESKCVLYYEGKEKTSFGMNEAYDDAATDTDNALKATGIKYEYDAQTEDYEFSVGRVTDESSQDKFLNTMKDPKNCYAEITVGYPNLKSPETTLKIKVYFSSVGEASCVVDKSFFEKANSF